MGERVHADRQTDLWVREDALTNRPVGGRGQVNSLMGERRHADRQTYGRERTR